MPEPQSPWDEPAAERPGNKAAGPTEPGPLPRKYSFMILAVLLFALLWSRELSGMTPGQTLAWAIGVACVWVALHARYFVDTSQWAATPSRGMHGSEDSLDPADWRRTSYISAVDLATLERAERQGKLAGEPGRTWPVLWIGMVLGVWMAYLVPLGVASLTVLLLVLYGVGHLVTNLRPRG